MPNHPIRQRGGQSIPVPVAAGATVTVPSFGTQAYLIVATAPVNMRARGRSYGASSYSLYQQGTGFGEGSNEQFDVVDVQNPNAVPVVILLWVGFGEFIDHRLILANVTNPNVAYPTYPVANASPTVDFIDLSGAQFTDINGGKWYALYRVAIIVGNVDSGTTYLLQKAGSTGPAAPAVVPIYPLTSLNYPASGNFRLNVGGGNINVIASEIYAAIPAT